MSFGLIVYHVESVIARQICLPGREMVSADPPPPAKTSYSGRAWLRAHPKKEAGTLRFRPPVLLIKRAVG
jgi:hypothetical protein